MKNLRLLFVVTLAFAHIQIFAEPTKEQCTLHLSQALAEKNSDKKVADLMQECSMHGTQDELRKAAQQTPNQNAAEQTNSGSWFGTCAKAVGVAVLGIAAVGGALYYQVKNVFEESEEKQRRKKYADDMSDNWRS